MHETLWRRSVRCIVWIVLHALFISLLLQVPVFNYQTEKRHVNKWLANTLLILTPNSRNHSTSPSKDWSGEKMKNYYISGFSESGCRRCAHGYCPLMPSGYKSLGFALPYTIFVAYIGKLGLFGLRFYFKQRKILFWFYLIFSITSYDFVSNLFVIYSTYY